MRKRSGQVHSRESSATLQLTVSLLYLEYLKSFKNVKYNGKIVDAFLSFTAVYPAGSHVLTNDGEEAIVVSQNKDFQDRPIIRIIRDKDGRKLQEERIVDLVKVLNVYIEKGLE